MKVKIKVHTYNMYRYNIHGASQRDAHWK